MFSMNAQFFSSERKPKWHEEEEEEEIRRKRPPPRVYKEPKSEWCSVTVSYNIAHVGCIFSLSHYKCSSVCSRV